MTENLETERKPMVLIEDRVALLDRIELKRGGHRSMEDGACAMELVSYLAGEPWSDHPQCASSCWTA